MISPTETSPSRYTADEIERALFVLALCAGNSARAARMLAEQGFTISDRTLRYWREERHATRYREVADGRAREVEDVIVQEAREIVVKAADLERRAIEASCEQLERGEVKDASTAARNASTVKGINIDKILSLTGRPTAPTHPHSADELIRKLQALGVIDGTATEILGVIDGTATEIYVPELEAG